MGVINRLEEFHSYLKSNGYGGRNKFEIEIGKKPGYLTGAIAKDTSIGSDVILVICDKFPELNLEWLITGKGEMLKTPRSSGESTSTNANGNTGGINGNVIGDINGNINGNGNHVGIVPADCEKELIKAQCESDYLKKEVKVLKEQLKQALSDKEKAISDKDMAMELLNKALSK